MSLPPTSHTVWAKRIKEMFPLCKECSRPTEEAHHIIPKKERPDLEFDLSNGVGLCSQCHIEKHVDERSLYKIDWHDDANLVKCPHCGHVFYTAAKKQAKCRCNRRFKVNRVEIFVLD